MCVNVIIDIENTGASCHNIAGSSMFFPEFNFKRIVLGCLCEFHPKTKLLCNACDIFAVSLLFVVGILMFESF